VDLLSHLAVAANGIALEGTSTLNIQYVWGPMAKSISSIHATMHRLGVRFSKINNATLRISPREYSVTKYFLFRKGIYLPQKGTQVCYVQEYRILVPSLFHNLFLEIFLSKDKLE